MEQLSKQLEDICKELFNSKVEIVIDVPEEKFGDYTTNIALKLSAELNQKPSNIAKQICEKLKQKNEYKEVSVAEPGFINITLEDSIFIDFLNQNPKINKKFENKVVVTEYSDPNPFKILHAGHLYTSIIGDAISNLFEISGAKVHRVNFGGDVGLHVAKTMWAILKTLNGENPDKLKEIPGSERSQWLSERYIEGNNKYEKNKANPEIIKLNKQVYQLHIDNDKSSKLAQIYWTTRQWSYDYFDEFYKLIGSKFEKYYPESQTTPIGLKTVNEQLEKGVYKKSEGAIVFDGEKYGLHTRVFITSQGLPTYEAKDVGLIIAKYNDYKFDESVVITGNDIVEYMKVVLKSIEQFNPKLANSSTHITHGIVKLSGGKKMSSRKGNILLATDILDITDKTVKELTGKTDNKVTLGAVKYSFLRQRTGGDIIYNPNESVSLEGNSGPYLQYAYVRALSILKKSKITTPTPSDLTTDERSLTRKLSEYPEIVEKAVDELMPHHVCTYIYELAQNFNRFYEKNRIIGDKREATRITIVKKYEQTLKNSFEVLNIPIVEKM